MPWSSGDAKKHIKGLTSEQAGAWAKIANSVLKSCKAKGGTDCEGRAVRIANSKAKVVKQEEDVDDILIDLQNLIVTDEYKMRRIKWKDIETKETDAGLLVKSVPVFKTGEHKGNKYTKAYIDDKIIGQFDPAEDIPLQADHSDSWNATLGYVKKVYRKGSILYADLLLIADNAVSRWKKGLMKKWSVSINKISGKLHEISAVAFPYVKEATVHGEVAEVGMKDYEIEETEKETKPPKRDIIEIDAHEERPESAPKENVEVEENETHEDTAQTLDWEEGISISIKSDGTQKGTSLTINDKKIKSDDIYFSLYGANLSVRYSIKKTTDSGLIERKSYEYRSPYVPTYNEGTKEWSQVYKNSLPDSSFALVKKPIGDRAKDRALPYKDANGKIDPANAQNSLARINQVKGFSSEAITAAKKELTAATKSKGIKVAGEKTKMSEERIESELLKEAAEKETKLTTDLKAKEEEVKTMKEDNKTKDEEIKKFKVDADIAELKAEGKITPAQEDKIKEFMLKLDDESRKEFKEVLKASTTKIKLEETAATETKKEEKKHDFSKMSQDEIDKIVDEYAKEKGIPANDARDILFDKYGGKAEVVVE